MFIISPVNKQNTFMIFVYIISIDLQQTIADLTHVKNSWHTCSSMFRTAHTAGTHPYLHYLHRTCIPHTRANFENSHSWEHTAHTSRCKRVKCYWNRYGRITTNYVTMVHTQFTGYYHAPTHSIEKHYHSKRTITSFYPNHEFESHLVTTPSRRNIPHAISVPHHFLTTPSTHIYCTTWNELCTQRDSSSSSGIVWKPNTIIIIST